MLLACVWPTNVCVFVLRDSSNVHCIQTFSFIYFLFFYRYVVVYVSNKDQPTSSLVTCHYTHVRNVISRRWSVPFVSLSWFVYPVLRGIRKYTTSACAASQTWPLGIARNEMERKKKEHGQTPCTALCLSMVIVENYLLLSVVTMCSLLLVTASNYICRLFIP